MEENGIFALGIVSNTIPIVELGSASSVIADTIGEIFATILAVDGITSSSELAASENGKVIAHSYSSFGDAIGSVANVKAGDADHLVITGVLVIKKAEVGR